MTFLLDPDPAAAGALAAILQGSGLTTEIFSDSAGFVRGLLTRTPSLVFLDVAGSGDDAIDALFAMGERGYGSAVQLIGDDVSPLVSVVRRMGERHSLQMLPSLRKPLETHAVRRVLNSQNLGTVPAATSATLDEALANGWVEFWYQPKIDLGKRQIAGVETFARDVKILVEGGYKLGTVLPIDQFRHSPHVEMTAVLSR